MGGIVTTLQDPRVLTTTTTITTEQAAFNRTSNNVATDADAAAAADNDDDENYDNDEAHEGFDGYTQALVSEPSSHLYDDATAGTDPRIHRILRLSKEDRDGELLLAAHRNEVREVALLLRFGARNKPVNWDALSTPFQLGVDGKNRWSALHSASREGHRIVARLLIENGADVNSVNGYLRTPMFYAAEHGRRNIINLLAEHGADPNKHDWCRTTPIHVAISRGHRSSVEALLANGADVHARLLSTYTPIHLAAKKGRVDVVRLCIEAGADVNQKAVSSKSTPLHEACKKCHSAVVDTLIKAGATVEVNDGMMRTPMRIAAALRDKRTEQLLLRAGAIAPHLQSAAHTEEEQEATRRARSEPEEARNQTERAAAGTGKALLRNKTMKLMSQLQK